MSSGPYFTGSTVDSPTLAPLVSGPNRDFPSDLESWTAPAAGSTTGQQALAIS
jgi:hypothetical protein